MILFLCIVLVVVSLVLIVCLIFFKFDLLVVYCLLLLVLFYVVSIGMFYCVLCIVILVVSCSIDSECILVLFEGDVVKFYVGVCWSDLVLQLLCDCLLDVFQVDGCFLCLFGDNVNIVVEVEFDGVFNVFQMEYCNGVFSVVIVYDV